MKLKAYFKETHAHYSSTAERIIISNEENIGFKYIVFLIITGEDSDRELFNIQIPCEYYCSLFRGVEFWNEQVIIGFDENCFLFNRTTKKITCHKLKSYFDNIFISEHYALICSSSYVNCFDKLGDCIYRSEEL